MTSTDWRGEPVDVKGEHGVREMTASAVMLVGDVSETGL